MYPDFSTVECPKESLQTSNAEKFTVMQFEKANFAHDKSGKRKKPIVSGDRPNFCATPAFAKMVKMDEIKTLSEALKECGKAGLLSKTLEGNQFQPCTFFSTSCNTSTVPTQVDPKPPSTTCNIFQNMSERMDESFFNITTASCISKAIGVTLDDSKRIEHETNGQRLCSAWFKERSRHLTSSLFGRIIKRRQPIFPKSILDQIQKTKVGRTVNAPSLQWGIDKEETVLAKYKENMTKPLQVISCGLMINPKWPWLGASPDGLVIHGEKLSGGLEIKCPYSKKNATILEACEDKTFFMQKTDEGPKVKDTHHYYHQCQGVMNIVGIKWMDFVLYTEKEFFCQRLHCNNKLWDSTILPKLAAFYGSYLADTL